MIKKKYFNLKFLYQRLFWEIKYPSNNFFKKIIITTYNNIKKLKYNKKLSNDDNTLFAFYDLNVSALTFNFAEFLALCHNELIRKKLNNFAVIFVQEDHNQFKSLKQYSDFHNIHDKDSMNWRFYNIILPLLSTSNKCGGHYLINSKNEISFYTKKKNIFPQYYQNVFKINYDINDFYKIDNLNDITLTCPIQALRYIDKWININNFENNKIVTLTLRYQDLEKVRNSNLEEWYKFAEYLQSVGYLPIIIPDTETCWYLKKKFKKFHVFTEPCWNLLLRMAIYEKSYVNYFVPNGPEMLATLNVRTSYIMLNLVPVKGSKVNTEDALKIFNKSDYKFSTKYQKLIFKKDSFENLVKSFIDFKSIK